MRASSSIGGVDMKEGRAQVASTTSSNRSTPARREHHQHAVRAQASSSGPGAPTCAKAFEVYFTILIEQLWGKRRILEVYLNVVEWGHGIYGVEAAAQRYFGVSAAQLDGNHAALSRRDPPAPHRFNPAAPSPSLQRRAATIAARPHGPRFRGRRERPPFTRRPRQ